MQIANPVSNSTPSYDGFWTLVEPTVAWGTISDTSITMTHDSSGQAFPYDLAPASDYDTTVDDTGTCTGSSSQWAWDDTDSKNKCLTQWRIGSKGIACVQVEASFKRDLAIESTESACDIELDYIDVVVSIRQGMVSETDTVPYSFSQTVPFGTFSTLSATTTSGAAELIPSVVVGLAGLLALKLF